MWLRWFATCVVVWAGYRFHFGRIADTRGAVFYIEEPAPRFLKPLANWLADNVPIPAPQLPIGLGIVKTHDMRGHLSYLFGRYSDRGWWYYFPVVFFFKTPIPFLILVLWGIVTIRDRLALQFVLVPIAILLVAMTSSINIGVRHIMPIYPPLAIVAAFAATTIWRRSSDPFARTTLVALVAWLIIGTAIAHPDYLAWFNEAAGAHPDRSPSTAISIGGRTFCVYAASGAISISRNSTSSSRRTRGSTHTTSSSTTVWFPIARTPGGQP